MAPELPDEAVIAGCSRYFFRGLSPGLTREDLVQEGRIALWLAQQAGRVPAEPEHRGRYVKARVIGAMHDANRSAWRQLPMAVGELDAVSEERTPGAAATPPDTILQIRECVEYLTTHVTRMKECLDLLAEGLSGDQVAARMGVSPSRISQLRREARRAAAAFI